MEVSKNKEINQTWYEEISLPILKIWETSGVCVITIPKKLMQKHNLVPGMKVQVILFKKRRSHSDALLDDEEWVKLSKRERIMFEQFSKDRQEYLKL